MTISLSSQQNDVMNWVDTGHGHAVVEAVAGSGKTFTLIQALKRLNGNVVFTAFNKSIAVEIDDKVKAMGVDNVEVKTMHSLGFAAWRNHVDGNVRVDANKKRKEMLKAINADGEYWGATAQLVSLAKNCLLGHPHIPATGEALREIIETFSLVTKVRNGDIPDHVHAARLVEYAQDGLIWSRAVGEKLIDFDDMIYLPLVTRGVRFRKFDWVLVDECQDTNVARRMLAEKMMHDATRSIWVGDRHQAIYGFTGANNDSVQRIINRFDATVLPLTTTYRCSKKATAVAQTWVPHIEAHNDNLDGTVQDLCWEKFEKEYATPGAANLLQHGDAVLCRLNRPLVTLAFHLLRNGIGCYVEGRDIGKGLLALTKKWKRVRTLPQLLTKLETYRTNETAKYQEKGNDAAIAALNDKLDTLITLTDGAETIEDVQNRIHELFADSDERGAPKTVVLSTVHKSKGREWDRVVVLGRHNFMPLTFRGHTDPQEYNLLYVAVTRTKNELIYAAAPADD